MRVLSLFDGISCGRLALATLGITPTEYYASEIDRPAIATTTRNWPKTIQLGDVTKLRAADLPKIDLLLAGSPCQGFSAIGQGLAFEDPRSKLYYEFLRLRDELTYINPKLVWLLENVAMRKAWHNHINDTCGASGFKICSRLFSAQRRARVYWTNVRIRWNNVLERAEPKTVQDIRQLDTEPNVKNMWVKHIADKQWVAELKLSYEAPGSSAICNILRQTNCILTAPLSQPGHRGVIRSLAPVHWYESAKQLGNLHARAIDFNTGLVESRRYTAIELERCQGLPDNYTLGTYEERHHQIGNGWTVPVISEILREVLRCY
jgi:DNA-cytosine methyltransferase